MQLATSGILVLVLCLMCAGGGFRTRDLQIMSIAFFGRPVRFYQANWHSNQAELPRHSLCLIIWEIK